MVLIMLKYFQDLFFVCNSGTYPEKEYYFYPLKDKLLRTHGKPDGYDLQIIHHRCWSCEGTGIYTHWDGDEEECDACEGTGIYRTVRVILARYILGQSVYHIPGKDYDLQDKSAPKNIIDGFIVHDDVDRDAVLRALKILLFRYDFPQFYSLMYELYRERKDGETVYWRRFLVTSFVSRLFYSAAILLSGTMPLWDSEGVEVAFKNCSKYKWLSWVMAPYEFHGHRRYRQVRVSQFKFIARLGLLFTGWSLAKYNANGLWCRDVEKGSFTTCKSRDTNSLNHYQWILNAYRRD
jgi:hypothetical protein